MKENQLKCVFFCYFQKIENLGQATLLEDDEYCRCAANPLYTLELQELFI